MSEHNWKPGDVATVRCDASEWHTALRVKMTGDEGDVWVCCVSGAQPSRFLSDARPLVVIDPEDRAQVERLDALIDDGLCGKDTPKWSGPADVLQAALREFANPTPPKPDEPTGLGAVVEDAAGKRWVRSADMDCSNPWNEASGYDSEEWSQIAVVRVLSEGVPS